MKEIRKKRAGLSKLILNRGDEMSILTKLAKKQADR